MSKPIKKISLALLASTIGLSAVPTHAAPPPEPVSVGILDVHAAKLPKSDKNTQIEYREFRDRGQTAARWPVAENLDHGQLVAGAFVDQVRKIDKDVPIRIVAANIFHENTPAAANDLLGRSTPRPKTLDVNWAAASDALDWFREKGVKVVLTSFVTNDNKDLRAFMAKADKLGMVVFASAGNVANGHVFPAKYPQTISVAADNKDMSFNKDPSISTWVDFTMDGYAARGIDTGSSFAVSKAAAFGSYYVAHHPEAQRQDIKSAIDLAAAPKSYKIAGMAVTTRYVDQDGSARLMPQIAMRPLPTSLAKGPVAVMPTLAAAQISAVSPER